MTAQSPSSQQSSQSQPSQPHPNPTIPMPPSPSSPVPSDSSFSSEPTTISDSEEDQVRSEVPADSATAREQAARAALARMSASSSRGTPRSRSDTVQPEHFLNGGTNGTTSEISSTSGQMSNAAPLPDTIQLKAPPSASNAVPSPAPTASSSTSASNGAFTSTATTSAPATGRLEPPALIPMYDFSQGVLAMRQQAVPSQPGRSSQVRYQFGPPPVPGVPPANNQAPPQPQQGQQQRQAQTQAQLPRRASQIPQMPMPGGAPQQPPPPIPRTYYPPYSYLGPPEQLAYRQYIVPRRPPPPPTNPMLELPQTLTDEQLARLDQLTREAIDERLQILDAVAGVANRLSDELVRVRSVLPLGPALQDQTGTSASASGSSQTQTTTTPPTPTPTTMNTTATASSMTETTRPTTAADENDVQ